MRIIIFIFFVLFVLVSKAEVYRGQIIKSNDTLDVVLKIPINSLTGEPKIAKLQNKVIYYDSLGKKRKLFPNQAYEFRFFKDGKEIRMLSRKAPYTDYNLFLKLEFEGKIKIFGHYGGGPTTEFYQSFSSEIDSFPINVIYFQKDDENLYKPRLKRKLLIDYFNDCKSLCEMIKYNDLSIQFLFTIVDYYNSYCGKQ